MSTDRFTELEGQAGPVLRKGYTQLRRQCGISEMECADCGPLVPDDGSPPAQEDWIHLCHIAMDHAQETGHEVAVQDIATAVYGPQR
jgi:hypothetical protein